MTVRNPHQPRYAKSDPDEIRLSKGLKEGDKVWFKGERHGYTVRGITHNGYVVLTKPFNAKKTVIYTIIDLDRGCRGVDNLVFSIGYDTEERCKESIEALARRDMDISHRNNTPIKIRKVERT